jgi:hypothetical protein
MGTIMNKLSKIIVSLMTSFALSFSAFAGELTVTGTAKATYSSLSGQVTGDNTIGVANELKFGAAGELDNGWTWDYFVELDPGSAAGGGNAINDDSSFAVTTPYGVAKFCSSECGLSAAGNFNANAYAWITDTAYAEGKVEPVNISSYQNMQLHTPAGLLPFSTVIKAAYAPSGSTVVNSANASNTTKIATLSNTTQYRVETTPIDGLDISASYTEQDGGDVTGATDEQQSESGTIAAKYAFGSFTVGLGKSYVAPRIADVTGSGATTIESYENNDMSIAFAVNDSLSLSYSSEKSEMTYNTSTTASFDQDTKSLQAAYTMGGMTLALARTDYDNVGYADTVNATENLFAVTMAF